MTSKERWEIAIAIGWLTFYVVYMIATTEGQGDGLAYRLRWHRDQMRRQNEHEREFQRLRNETLFEAWYVVNSARPN